MRLDLERILKELKPYRWRKAGYAFLIPKTLEARLSWA
jgi:hypothetical protein